MNQPNAQREAAIHRFLSGGGRVPVSFGPYTVFPGFCDLHVHFREPGYFYKETIASGSLSAARGGYTAVCTMPNLDPVPDCPENLRPQLERIRETAAIPVYPYGARPWPTSADWPPWSAPFPTTGGGSRAKR